MTPPDPDGPGIRLDGDTLTCGADVDALLEQVADGHGDRLDDHQRDCVQCQAAIAEFSRIWAPVTELAGTPITPPPALAEGVMRRVRTLVTDTWYTLDTTDDGVITVAARIVAVLARDAARRVPGVRVALGRSTESRLVAMVEKATLRHRHPHAAVGVLGRTAVVDLAIAVTYPQPAHDIAREVQRSVIDTLQSSIGLRTVHVNVTVDDVLSPE